MDATNEPVRVSGWVALTIGLALQAAILWAVDTPTKAIVGALALQAVLSIGGLEWARNRVTPVDRG